MSHLADSSPLDLLQKAGESVSSLWEGRGVSLLSERIWSGVQCWPLSFDYLCLSQGQTAVVYKDPVGTIPLLTAGKYRESQPYLPHLGEGKMMDVDPVAGGACPWSKMQNNRVLCMALWEEGEPVGPHTRQQAESLGQEFVILRCRILPKALASGKIRLLSKFWPKGNFTEAAPWAKQQKYPRAGGADCFILKPNRKEGEKLRQRSFVSSL